VLLKAAYQSGSKDSHLRGFFGPSAVLLFVPKDTLRCKNVCFAGKSRIHSYISDENVFFAITFSLYFMLGMPCALVGLLG
jgi:hypothetical protein